MMNVYVVADMAQFAVNCYQKKTVKMSSTERKMTQSHLACLTWIYPQKVMTNTIALILLTYCY